MADTESGYRTTVTLNGLDVVIYNHTAGGDYPIHGAYHAGDDHWYMIAWTKEGKKIMGETHALDLAVV